VFRCDVIISLSERTQRRTGRKERKEERWNQQVIVVV
jgi:hypothetical protein